ncbi:MAG: hypothetical protein QNK51_02240 [Chitinophagales bacterium]|tara:strand:- start:106 stop:300 length:195 start_codon:yes stop_codon:yes gene_type:complete
MKKILILLGGGIVTFGGFFIAFGALELLTHLPSFIPWIFSIALVIGFLFNTGSGGPKYGNDGQN